MRALPSGRRVVGLLLEVVCTEIPSAHLYTTLRAATMIFSFPLVYATIVTPLSILVLRRLLSCPYSLYAALLAFRATWWPYRVSCMHVIIGILRTRCPSVILGLANPLKCHYGPVTSDIRVLGSVLNETRE
jgi:hypothetical protein